LKQLPGLLLLETNEAALFQQRSSNNIQVLTYLSIVSMAEFISNGIENSKHFF
jgi:hypothetical protein